MDVIVRAFGAEGNIKVSALSAKGLVERARGIQGSSPTVTAALGRLLCAASMLGEAMKEPDALLTMRINGGGPAGTLIAVSDSAGNVRGYAQCPEVSPPLRGDGKLNVGEAVGKRGMLTVSRDLGLREPYVGSTELVSGEIAEDVAAYLSESEQVGSACGLGVLVGRESGVLAAGGFIAQLLPGAPEELAEALERNIAAVGPVSEALSQGGAEELARAVLRGLEPRILETHPVEYRCYCSREKVIGALESIGARELRDMAEEGKPADVTCQFCDEVYTFTPEEIAALAASVGE